MLQNKSPRHVFSITKLEIVPNRYGIKFLGPGVKTNITIPNLEDARLCIYVDRWGLERFKKRGKSDIGVFILSVILNTKLQMTTFTAHVQFGTVDDDHSIKVAPIMQIPRLFTTIFVWLFTRAMPIQGTRFRVNKYTTRKSQVAERLFVMRQGNPPKDNEIGPFCESITDKYGPRI